MSATAQAPGPPQGAGAGGTDGTDAPGGDVRMTIWEHLEELRRRIINAAIGRPGRHHRRLDFREKALAWLVIPYQRTWIGALQQAARPADARAGRRLPRLPRALADRGRRRRGAGHLLPAVVVHLAGPLQEGEAAHRAVRLLLDDAVPVGRGVRVLRRVPVHVQLLPVAARPGARRGRAHADRDARVLPRLQRRASCSRSAPSSSCRSSSRSWCWRTS